MLRLSSISLILFIVAVLMVSQFAKAQPKCSFFTEYRNELKNWAASAIDSLRQQGIDTIIFYSVAAPESGRVAYGKIIWAKGIVKTLEINSKFVERTIQLTMPKYDSNASRQPIQFYYDYRLDTVKTLPKELRWRSHDYIHFIYSNISGIEDCFVAEHYLLHDSEHRRTQWIWLLCDFKSPWVLTQW